jgi:CheY-like chemotaxis protein
VLVVDDDAVTRRLLAISLGDEGWSVRGVQDGEKALASCAEHLPDLMLLDLRMPTLDGFGVLAELERRGWRLFPIIVVSGEASAGRTLGGRVRRVIAKPIDFVALISYIRLEIDRDGAAPA